MDKLRALLTSILERYIKKLKRKTMGGKFKDYIPDGLEPDEQDVYNTILNAVDKRKGKAASAEAPKMETLEAQATKSELPNLDTPKEEALPAQAPTRKSTRLLAAKLKASKAEKPHEQVSETKSSEAESARPEETPEAKSLEADTPTVERLAAEAFAAETAEARIPKARNRKTWSPDDGPPRIVVITDLAKDFDDLLAMIVLKELHRLGAIQLLAFIANLEPARERARLGRGALDQLGLAEIPIAIGSRGLEPDAEHKLHDYEFKGSDTFIAPEDRVLPEGQELLKQIFLRAKEENYMITLLTLSSLMDIAQFMDENYELLADRLQRCVLQGGYIITEDKRLIADMAATNNSFSPSDADRFHAFLYKEQIPSTCFTKVATFATPIYQTLLTQMARTGVSVGRYLKDVQIGQDLYFWKCASYEDPKKRFRPFMDREWFLRNKTTWYATDKTIRDTTHLDGEGILKWLDKLTAYDCLAAMGTAQDILEALDVVRPIEKRTDAIHPIHETVGVLEVLVPGTKERLKAEEANVDGIKFALVIRALALGSLKAVDQKMFTRRC